MGILRENISPEWRKIGFWPRDERRKGEKKNMKKIKKQVSFYAKMNEIKNVYFSDMSMILIVYKKEFNTNKLNYCIPSIYVSLLYENIFPNKTLSGLPPIRWIEHQIDLVPEETISNQSTYRSNLDETKEIQMQVDELMSKGYIR